MTPKIIRLMRQQLGEWAEEDQKEKAMVECETMVRKQKLEEVLCISKRSNQKLEEVLEAHKEQAHRCP